MRFTQKLIVPAIAAVAVLAGTPAALAATSSHATVAAAATPAVRITPDIFKWLYYGSYPTLHACKSEGDHIVFEVNLSYTFKCIEYSEGSYFVYKLFVGVPE